MTSAPRSARSFVQYWPISPARSRTRMSPRVVSSFVVSVTQHATRNVRRPRAAGQAQYNRRCLQRHYGRRLRWLDSRVGRGRTSPPLLFDRRADERAPLGPGALVVLYVLVAEQVRQHEPGVRRALADAAVGDDFLVRGYALATIYRHQLVGVLERTVFVACLAPADVEGARDVAAPLRAFLRQVLRRQELA